MKKQTILVMGSLFIINQNPFIIREVLQKRMNKPIELLIFDSCNMATVEVAYEFKDLVTGNYKSLARFAAP